MKYSTIAVSSLAAVLLFGCQTTRPLPEGVTFSNPDPIVDIAERRRLILSLSPEERREYCADNHSFYSEPGIISAPAIKISGSVDFATVNSQVLIVASLNRMISSYVGGEDNLERIYDGLTNAARERAYEILKPYRLAKYPTYNAYNEPLYYQAQILQPLGVIFPELERVYGVNDPGVQAIRAWGNRLFASVTSGKGNPRQGGPDQPAGKAMAFVTWGAAIHDAAVINAGYDQYYKALSTIGYGGKDIIWYNKVYRTGTAVSTRSNITNDVRYRDLVGQTYGLLVIAAEALVQAGLPNAYDLPEPGRSIHDAVAWILAVTEPGDPHAKIYGGGARALSWFEIYAARFPDRASMLKKESVLEDMHGRFFGVAMGGGTTCLFRPIEQTS